MGVTGVGVSDLVIFDRNGTVDLPRKELQILGFAVRLDMPVSAAKHLDTGLAPPF
jgi:hypothetical protein